MAEAAGHTHLAKAKANPFADPKKKPKKEDAMSKTPADYEKDAATAATRIADLEKALARANAFGGLSDIEKAFLGSLREDERDGFIAKSSSDRIALAKGQLEVVYTDLDGGVYTKRDDPRTVANAKRADAATKALGDSELRKRAESEVAGLPGTVDQHVELLRAVDKIADEPTRKASLEALKAGSAAVKKAIAPSGGRATLTKSEGHSASDGAGDQAAAEAELNEKAKEIATAKGVSEWDAYDLAAKAHPDLAKRAIGSTH
jgi:hypothetical protein